MIWPEKKSTYRELHEALFEQAGIRVFVLRDDLLHPGISGNKWRKLKYNLLDAFKKGRQTIVTVGGSHSNHIAAVAEAGREFGFRTIGLIRGYESYRSNPTLQQAADAGMEIRFLDKAEFALLESEYLPKLKSETGCFEFVPMGGGNLQGMRGCVEINDDLPPQTTHIAVACGTGSTLAGIAAGATRQQSVLGFPAMKNGGFLREDIVRFLREFGVNQPVNFELILDFHFGGFAKMNVDLIDFLQQFYHRHRFALDGIYTGKMMFGLYEMIRAGFFERGSVITAIHTGGVQGNKGLMKRYGCKLPM